MTRKKPQYSPDDRLDNASAAAYIEKSGSWLNKERSQGRGPRFLKIGASIRYMVRDLDEYLRGTARETVDSRRAAA